ncbi:MAG: hypothetical protein IT373_06345 [Polyangiaceae bacterium]|nr:hypothetical protein [Polyangiaceae bacterium]
MIDAGLSSRVGSGKSVVKREHGDKRRAPRRNVELACELVTDDVDEPLLRWATDLSPFGLWLEAAEPLGPGETVVVCLEPPVCWPRGRELVVFAGVTRAGWGRRVADRGASGMGLDFIDLSPHEERVLRSWLGWRPTQPRRRFGMPRRARAGELGMPPAASQPAVAWPSDVRSVRECAHLPVPRPTLRVRPSAPAHASGIELGLEPGEDVLGGLGDDYDGEAWGLG